MLGAAVGYAKTNSAAIPYIVFVHCYSPQPGGAWRVQVRSITLLNAVAMVGSVPYIKHAVGAANFVIPLLQVH